MTNPDAGHAGVFSADRLLRNYRLHRIITAGGCEVVDGVTIDLRSDLDAKDWQPVNPLGLYGGPASAEQPGVVFPWTPSGWADFFEEQGEAVPAPVGSTVRLEILGDLPARDGLDGLDDPRNTDRKVVKVLIQHADGTVVAVRSRLFYMRTAAVASMIDLGDYSAAFRGMLARLEEATGIDEIEERLDDPVDGWPEPTKLLTPAFADALMALQSRERDYDGHAMAAFGYMMARAEAEAQLVGLAKRGAKNARSTSTAAAAKRAQARASSEPVRARAREIIRRKPTITLTACARQIAGEIQRDAPWVHRTIRELFVRNADGRTYRPRCDDDT